MTEEKLIEKIAELRTAFIGVNDLEDYVKCEMAGDPQCVLRYVTEYFINQIVLSKLEKEQLSQIHDAPVWDGDLISKTARDRLVFLGLVRRDDGYNILTDLGNIFSNYKGVR